MHPLIWVAIVMVGPVVAGSLFLCAPKWWAKNAPRGAIDAVERMGNRVDAAGAYVAALPAVRYAATPFAVVGYAIFMVALGLVLAVANIVILYVQACVALIEGACPYTHNDEWRTYTRETWEFMTQDFGEWLDKSKGRV